MMTSSLLVYIRDLQNILESELSNSPTGEIGSASGKPIVVAVGGTKTTTRSSRIQRALQALHQCPISIEILRETMIAKTVKKFKRDNDVGELACRIIREWKERVRVEQEEEKQEQSSSSKSSKKKRKITPSLSLSSSTTPAQSCTSSKRFCKDEIHGLPTANTSTSRKERNTTIVNAYYDSNEKKGTAAYPNNSSGNAARGVTSSSTTMTATTMTTVCNVKVKYIRPSYKNLQCWMMNEGCNVYIGRRGVVFVDKKRFPPKDSIWANPFKISKSSTRKDVLCQYEEYIRKKLEDDTQLQKQLLQLKGKRLGCWCHPEPCHGDVLVKLIHEYS